MQLIFAQKIFNVSQRNTFFEQNIQMTSKTRDLERNLLLGEFSSTMFQYRSHSIQLDKGFLHNGTRRERCWNDDKKHSL